MFDAIGTILAWLYDLTNNYGLSIMLLTLAIMVALTPLTLKGTRSMIAMQRLQPEIKKLQNKYKDDRQKLNEETMKFYKENSINPVGGCLPLLLQTPVFIVLYRVLHGLTYHAPFGQDMGRAFGYSANGAGTFEGFGTFHPDHLDTSSQMYQDLSSVREMKSFGLDLATSASKTLSDGLVGALPYLVLIAIIAVTAWYQQRQIQGRNPAMQQQINPQQQMLMKIMPFFLPLISFTLPAGITLYFVVSNLYRIGQQGFITRTMYRDAHGNPVITTTAVDSSSTDDGPPKGFFAQLKEIAGNSGPPPPPSNKGSKGSGSQGKGSGRANLSKSAKGAQAKGSSGKSQSSKPAASSKSSSSKSTATSKPPKDASVAKVEGGESAASKSAAAPSRQAPAANPNRSRSKKKRS